MRNGHGGARRGAGRPMRRRNLRPIGALQSILTEDEKHLGLIPVEFSGDSLEFLRATMMGKIWPTREQIYAAKSILAVEHLAAATIAGRSIDDIREEVRKEFMGGGDREDYVEKILDQIRRIREATPLHERVHQYLTDDLADESGQVTDDDQQLIEQVVSLIKARRPAAHPIAQLALPPSRR